MFDKKQKKCVKRIHTVTDDGLYDQKAFYKLKIVFYSLSEILMRNCLCDVIKGDLLHL